MDGYTHAHIEFLSVRSCVLVKSIPVITRRGQLCCCSELMIQHMWFFCSIEHLHQTCFTKPNTWNKTSQRSQCLSLSHQHIWEAAEIFFSGTEDKATGKLCPTGIWRNTETNLWLPLVIILCTKIQLWVSVGTQDSGIRWTLHRDKCSEIYI